MSIGDRQALLRFAARAVGRNNHHKLVRFFRRWGLKPLLETSTDKTLIHVAVWSDSVECARVLLQSGYTPIYSASVAVRSVRMAALLLDHGADVNAADTRGCVVCVHSLYSLALRSYSTVPGCPGECSTLCLPNLARCEC